MKEDHVSQDRSFWIDRISLSSGKPGELDRGAG